jgi:hypothetical protein
MPLHILNSDWLSQNANRNYPLDDGATCVSDDESFTLPPGFLLDMVWPVHAALGGDPRRFFIRSMVSTGDTIIGNLSYLLDDGINQSVVGSFLVPVEAHRSGGLYAVTGVGEFSDSVGRVVIGNLEGVLAQGGLYRFGPEATRLAPAVVRPNLRGVSSIRVASAAGESDPLVGDVHLREGYNIRLTVEDGNVIRIDAVDGGGLSEDCGCDTGRCIQTINGIGPDANLNFTLTGDECLNIQPMASGLKLVDLCSNSCCGCDQLTAMVNDINQYTQSLQRMEALLAKLEGKVDNATDNVLASFVNDPGRNG